MANSNSLEAGTVPSRFQAAVFLARVSFCRVRHALTDRPRCKKFEVGLSGFAPALQREVRSPLWTSERTEELALEMGKVQNLRIAAKAIDGVQIPAGETFSFWRHVGAPSKRRGFVHGRALVQGCIVPSIGGGLCQLTNALYEAAKHCDFTIVERHAHSLPISPAIREGRDATIAWNYLDLRFRANRPCSIEVCLTHDELVVCLKLGEAPISGTVADLVPTKGPLLLPMVETQVGSCETCGIAGCFRGRSKIAQAARVGNGRTAFLLDGRSPEAEKLLKDIGGPSDTYFIPLAPKLAHSRYRWELPASHCIHTSLAVSLLRSAQVRRKLSPPDLRRIQLKWTDRLAESYARRLAPDETELVVDLGLLRVLFSTGSLGGRRVTVLMTQFPLKLIHEHLDEAAKIYPEAADLRDFRASSRDADLQWAALGAASQLITPHPYLTNLLRQRLGVPVEVIPWVFPSAPPAPSRDDGYVYFAGPGASREGAIAMREAAKELHLKVVLGGRNLLGPEFWRGCDMLDPATNPMSGASVVVCGALFKNRPSDCLKALALSKPLIATPGCGIPADWTVPFGNAVALVKAIQDARLR